MDQDERADYQQYMDEVRRHAEEEAARYLAAHPPQTACSIHPERAIAGYVYVKRGNLWPKDARCAECMEGAESMALSNAIKRDKAAWGGEPDNIMVGGSLYTRGTGGYHVKAENTKE